MTDTYLAGGLVEIPLDELRALQAACEPIPDYASNPTAWLEDWTGEYAWELQRRIWISTETTTRTAVISCNNSGKTWLAARIVMSWVTRYWREGVRVVTTAPTAAQVSLLLWQEVRAAYQAAKDRGKNVPGWIVGSPYPQWKIGHLIAAFGRKPADSAQSAMQGVHAPHVLVVLDEAGGLAKTIYDAAEKITTTGHCSILAIGNPDTLNSRFAKICRPNSGWVVIRVDGLRTPNFTREQLADKPLTRALMAHEGIPFNTEAVPEDMRKVMLNPDWVEKGMTAWCGIPPDAADRMPEDELGQFVADRCDASQLFTAAVRGRFPEIAGESMIPLGWALRAQERWKQWQMGDEEAGIPPRATPEGRRVVGVDVATPNGADETVIAPRSGHVVYGIHRYPMADTEDTIGYAFQHCNGIPQAIAVVDVIGVGAGVRDGLGKRSSVSTVGFNASSQSHRRDRHGNFRFANDRAAAWWRLRELLDPAYGATLCLPDDEQLLAELTAPKWWVTTSKGVGIIHVESKDEIRKRLSHSTDSADAVIHSTWIDGIADGGESSAIPWGGVPHAVAPAYNSGVGTIGYKVGAPDDEDDEDYLRGRPR